MVLKVSLDCRACRIDFFLNFSIITFKKPHILRPRSNGRFILPYYFIYDITFTLIRIHICILLDMRDLSYLLFKIFEPPNYHYVFLYSPVYGEYMVTNFIAKTAMLLNCDSSHFIFI